VIDREVCEYISENRSMPDLASTMDETLMRWLSELHIANMRGDNNFGESFSAKVADLRLAKKEGNSATGSKYSRVLASNLVLEMMICLNQFGFGLQRCDGMRVNGLQDIVRVHGGVSGCF